MNNCSHDSQNNSSEMNQRNGDQQNLSQEAQAIKSILDQLKSGASPESLTERFSQVFADKPATAISDAEQELMKQGVSSCDLAGLCDVHAQAISGGTMGEHLNQVEFYPPHPLAYFQLDGQALIDRFRETIRPCIHGGLPQEQLPANLKAFADAVEQHFSLKENVLFAYLDKHGVSGPTKVMWSADDEIRANLKSAVEVAFAHTPVDVRGVVSVMHHTFGSIREQLTKEQAILIPLVAEHLSDQEIQAAGEDMMALGYNFENARLWVAPAASAQGVPAGSPAPAVGSPVPASPSDAASHAAGSAEGGAVLSSTAGATFDAQTTSGAPAAAVPEFELNFPTGKLSSSEIMLLLNNAGVEITYVDANDEFKYFNQAEEMYFVRTKSALGNSVYDCHPQPVQQYVKRILDNLRSGASDTERLIAYKKGRKFLVTYKAIRSAHGAYLGCMETCLDLELMRDYEAQAERATSHMHD